MSPRRGRNIIPILNNLYATGCNSCASAFVATGQVLALGDDAKERILRHISSKSFDVAGDIEQELFNHTLNTLSGAIDKVFGDVKYGDANFDFVGQLKSNTAVFSAFKTHRQQNDLHAQIFDDKGRPRSFVEFRKAAEPIIGNYNGAWLQTEYSTAILRAQTAAQMLEAERNVDIFPNLEWMPSTSVDQRESHKALYHKVFAVGDPFLAVNAPGSLWNCKCSLISTDKPVSDKSDVKKAAKQTPPPAPGLDGNPAKTAQLFSDSHPYVRSCVGGSKAEKIVALEGQKLMSGISRKNVRTFFQNTLKEPQIIKVANGPVGSVSISYQNVKSITGKPHKFNYQRNQTCYFLPEILKIAKYVGCSPDIKPGQLGHNDILRWHYYKFKLNGENSFITIKETQDNICRMHSIQDADHFKSVKIKEKPKQND